jgi:hypothetical protein
LRFRNLGKGAGQVNREDDLSGVLDDAELVGDVVSSDTGWTVSSIDGDNRFTVAGPLQPGDVVTVTYTVRIKPDDQRVADGGDDQIVNFLGDPGETHDDECVPGDPHCDSNPIPRLVDDKTVDPASGTVVVAGDELTYTLTFGNEGKGAGQLDREDDISNVLDDAKLISDPVASDPALTVSPIDDDGRFTVTGPVQPNQVITITYVVRVLSDDKRVANGGDDQLVNFLGDPGEDHGDCVAPDPDCTGNPVPRLVDHKSVDPATGQVVQAGQTLTYTLTFGNEGKGEGEVDRVDNIAQVLDDAALVGKPTVSDSALTASSVTDGVLSITGTLKPGGTVTVSYQVVVRPEGQRGDNLLANYLLDPGEQTYDCQPGDEDCTLNPAAEITAAKSVNPRSGALVDDGQRLVYRLTFVNHGKGTGDVAYDDDLSGVLDDAEMVRQPTSSRDTVTVARAAGVLRIRGTLAAGAKVVVTYAVRVREGRDGDDTLLNFLHRTGTETPQQCSSTSDLCTRNPIDVPHQISGGNLANSGGPQAWLLIVGLGVLLLGSGVVAMGRRRRSSIAE